MIHLNIDSELSPVLPPIFTRVKKYKSWPLVGLILKGRKISYLVL